MSFMATLFLAAVGLALGKVQYVGVNIAGLEFGCEINGTCPTGSAQVPLSALGGADGLGQMQHFVGDDQMNIFRLTVSWQFLVNNNLAGPLDPTNFGKYDQLMQACLGTGAMCAIDVHNFARWNGAIIGQGGPTNDQFAGLWTQLSTKYLASTNVIFGLMNEPHDLDVPTWATTVQAAVTAIRNAGATSQMILMPGTNFASAGQFVSSGSADALGGVTNPDGSKAGLIYDLHKYLDTDNSGTHDECTTDNIADAFQIAGDYLRANGRQALVSETGAGSTDSCFTDFCAQNAFLDSNSDVFLGYIAWAAGSFATSYVLALTPTKTNGKFVDQKLLTQCVQAPWISAAATTTSALPTMAAVSNSSTAAKSLTDSMNSGSSSSTDIMTETSTATKVAATLTRTVSQATSAGAFASNSTAIAIAVPSSTTTVWMNIGGGITTAEGAPPPIRTTYTKNVTAAATGAPTAKLTATGSAPISQATGSGAGNLLVNEWTGSMLGSVFLLALVL